MNLVTDKGKCCGCGACAASCSKDAIRLKEDKNGFLYPYIDKEKCIGCGLCKSVCIFGNKETGGFAKAEESQSVYAVVNKNTEILKNSSSGGAFAAIAQYIFDKNGVVFGSAWGDDMMPVHIPVESMEELFSIQGSKYVQSNMEASYKQVKHLLMEDKYVLFSGTPCQCDALRSFLGKTYDKLYCVELICHGVPNAHYFHEFVEYLQEKYNGKIKDIKFRDKRKGWGALLKITYIDNHGIEKTKYLKPEECYYYYYYFYKGLFFRESCYSCPYACSERKSDFTIGDFWGVTKFHSEFNSLEGVSVLIVSGEKGKNTINELKDHLTIVESSMDYVMEENGQICKASAKDISYEKLLDIYRRDGTKKFAEEYQKTHRKEILKAKLKRFMPLAIKRSALKITNKK